MTEIRLLKHESRPLSDDLEGCMSTLRHAHIEALLGAAKFGNWRTIMVSRPAEALTVLRSKGYQVFAAAPLVTWRA
jgi:hypothetical protein